MVSAISTLLNSFGPVGRYLRPAWVAGSARHATETAAMSSLDGGALPFNSGGPSGIVSVPSCAAAARPPK